MELAPDRRERTARVLSELSLGLPVLCDSGSSLHLIASAETTNSDRLASLRALGNVEIALTSRRASVVRAMVYDDDLARIELPNDVSLEWVRSMADPTLDLRHPMKGPFKVTRGGDATVARTAIRLCKQARLLPAALVVDVTAHPRAAFDDLIEADINDLVPLEEDLIHITDAHVPLSVARNTRVHVFGHGSDFSQHYAIEIGRPSRSRPVLSRLHSACFTGDILGSLKCDCGAQLKAALHQIAAEGAGVLLYLNQEGRGIGLANKLRAYALQDQGFDTVEANHRLGFEDDERDFKTGAHILQRMGFNAVRLMTNNPAKIARMEEAGVRVTERVPHLYGETEENKAYLATKAAKSGHVL